MFVPVFHLSICYLFMLLIQTIISQSPCIYDVGNGQQLDIRTLGYANGKGPKYDNIPVTSSVPRTLNWNGCFTYSKSDSGSCTDAAACYTDIKTGISTLIAKQTDVQLDHHDDKLNLLIYRNSNIRLTVSLTCRDADEDSINGGQDSAEIFNIYIQSRCCCPGKCHYSNDSLSGGAIFVIILVAILFVYLVGGMIFLKFSRGATGPDIIPNRLIWLNITSYAIEGFRYSIQVIRHRSFSVEYQKI